ncbi:MAG TPA: twin-arginine translocase TatA/TatE family subunit [Gammaproteobacteria bacterium]|nr:twin-arginine translocase TatA/TatE family subunit [Gammaproteobacteria bacterium]
MELSIGKILLILVIVVLVFGTAKIPRIGEDIGKAFRSFKRAMHEGENDSPAAPRDADKKSDSDNTH